MISREYPDNAEELYVYDSLGYLVQQTDADGVQVLYAYNSLGEQTVVALDLNQNGVIDYNGTDRITRTAREVVEVEDEVRHRVVTEVWEANNDDTATVVQVNESSVNNRQRWQTSYGLTTWFESVYTGEGDRTDFTVYTDGSTIIRTYEEGRLVAQLREDADEVTLSETVFSYDPHGRLISQEVTDIGITSYTYYADDQIASMTTPDPDPSESGPGYDAQTTSFAYNSRGWQSQVIHPDESETHTTYYPTGQVKRTWGSRAYPVEYTYDWQGRVKTLKTWKNYAGNSGEAVTTWNYDVQRGWLIHKRYANSQGPSYAYTPAGRLASRTWVRGVVTSYDYNNGGDLSEVTYSDSTPSVTHTYDRLGRPHTTSDAAGLLTRSYSEGQLVGEAYTGTGVLSGQSITRSLDSLNRVESLSATSMEAISYSYDAASRLSSVSQGDLSADYAYHPALGRVSSVIVKAGSTERARSENSYDRLGRTTRVDTLGNGSTLYTRRDYTYNDLNQRTRVAEETGRHWAYGYDELGQVILAEKRLSDDTTVLPGYEFGFDYDDIGNRIETLVNGRVSQYTSNALNRYTQRDDPGAIDVRGRVDVNATVQVNEQATVRTGEDYYREVPYDNYVGLVDTEIKLRIEYPTWLDEKRFSVHTTGKSDPYLLPQTPESFVYDADGNLIGDGRYVYTWDGENRLIQVELSSAAYAATDITLFRQRYEYDGMGRRIRRTVEIEMPDWEGITDDYHLYDGWNLLIEAPLSVESRSTPRTYVWGLDLSGGPQGAGGVGGLLWGNLIGWRTFIAGYDANGNIIAWVDAQTGWLGGRRDYGPFGETLMQEGNPDLFPFGFSTKYQERHTGLYYYGYRYYNPSTGSWLSRDPAKERGGLNLYGFVKNNGVNRVDWLGLNPTIKDIATVLQAYIENLRDNDLRKLFLVTQKCILDGLSEGQCCVGIGEDPEWINDVVREFMEPLLSALSGAPNDPWKEVFNNLKEAENILENHGAVHRWIFELGAARDMAITHIGYDLREAITLHGVGTDKRWKCIGIVVEKCERIFFNKLERILGGIAGMIDSSFDVSRMRDDMREDVRNQ